jgi:hypothetical protein
MRPSIAVLWGWPGGEGFAELTRALHLDPLAAAAGRLLLGGDAEARGGRADRHHGARGGRRNSSLPGRAGAREAGPSAQGEKRQKSASHCDACGGALAGRFMPKW